MSSSISIVIPAHNEERFINACLASIVTHLHDAPFEVIVIDNGSTDGTAAVACNVPGVTVLSTERVTIGAARNMGAARIKGHLIAFLDADVEITAQWAEAVKALLTAGRIAGPYIGGYALGVPARASLIERAWFAPLSRIRPKYLGGANIVISAALFSALGGFDERLMTAEDEDLCRRAEQMGARIDFSPDLNAVHLGFPSTLSRFVKREVWHGTGDAQSLRQIVGSRTAALSVLFLMLAVATLSMLLAGHMSESLIVLCVLLALPGLLTIYKFRLHEPQYFPLQYLLSMAYLAARSYATVRGLLGVDAISRSR